MKCPQCAFENPASVKFCGECGARLRFVCSSCGAESPPGFKFCGECGAPLTAASPIPATPLTPAVPAPVNLEERFTTLQEGLPAAFREQLLTPSEGENRIVTVLFADMSRSVEATRNLPPEEAAALVNRLLGAMVDALLKYEGRVDRFLGDGVLAVFGVPQAHESDPERAVLAAIEIRQAAEQMGQEVTAGIQTGEVYVGGMGSKRHQEVTVMGPVVNLAARLQGQAEPGQILVGEATYRQTCGAFEYLPRTLSIRGLAEPVTAYEMQRPLPRPEKRRGIEGLRARLIAREKEVTSLIEAVDSLAQERRGQIVTVVGEAGIGKTRLVSELKEHLSAHGIAWLEGRCISIGQSVSFWPFIDIMRTYLGISGEDREKEIAETLVGKIGDLFPQDAEGIIPYVGQMLSVKLEERYQERIRHAAPEQIRRQTLLRMRDFFVALARKEPLALILEDLHWADDLSLDLLWVLMDELVAAPILLVCVYRPEREHGCWRIHSTASSKHLERYTPLHLKPLTQQEGRQMVESLLAMEDLPAAMRATILERTEGNPFFVEEVVRLLIERGVFYREEGLWKAKDSIGALTVPDTIRSIILSRIDRLQGEVRYVLQCASVIGRVFQRRLLEYLSGQEEALEQHLSQLEDSDLVYQERTVPELEYAFKHALTQETAYEGMLSRHRKVFHERVGGGIEALYHEQIEEYYELLAFHYSRSDNREKAIEYLAAAGRKAAARYANREALAYFEKALTLAEGSDAYDPILARRAKLLVETFQGKEAASDYERLLQSAREREDQSQELESLLGLAEACYVMALDDTGLDCVSRSRELYEAAYALARQSNDKAAMVRSLLPTVWFSDFWFGYRAQAAANVEHALDLSRQIGDEDLILECRFYRLVLQSCIAGLHGSVMGPIHLRSGEDRREEGSRRALARAAASDSGGMGVDAVENPRVIEALGEELVHELEARHDQRRLGVVCFSLTWMHLFWGNSARAIECGDLAIQLAGEMGISPVQYPTLKALAGLGLGRYGDAKVWLQEEVADEEHPFGQTMREVGEAAYHLELMAYEKAAGSFKRVIEHGRRLRRAWMQYSGYIGLALSLARAGRLDDGSRRGVLAELESLDATFPPAVVGEIYFCEGRVDEALQEVERAASQSEESGSGPAYVAALELKLRILLRQERPLDVLALADELLRRADAMGHLPMVWRFRAARAEAMELLGDTKAIQEYQAAAAVIEALAATIDDAELRQGFLSNDRVSSILAAAKTSVEERG